VNTGGKGTITPVFKHKAGDAARAATDDGGFVGAMISRLEITYFIYVQNIGKSACARILFDV